MSFFSLSSSSSSTPSNTPTLGYSQQDPLQNLEKWKGSLLAIPSGMAINDPKRTVNHKVGSNRKRNIKGCDIISKTYNVSASRPLQRSLNHNQVYVANLRLDNVAVLTTNTVTDALSANQFSLNDFAGKSAYTGLFDQYKILEFECWIEPVNAPSVGIANIGYLVTAVDLDDANAPSTLVNVENKQNSITSNSYDGHYHRWEPHMAVACYSGAFTSFASSPPMWIDVASPSVQHYGIKYGAKPTSAAITFQLQLRARIAFRQSGI